MKRILINFAHPAKSHSKINVALRKSVEGLNGVTYNDLYATYPDFMIDYKREQKLCEAHDVIIFQFPFYWYSTPAIIKEWEDLVLEHGWAYGSKGKALKGKQYLMALTAGGDKTDYQQEGYNNYHIGELLSPYHAMSKLCSMQWLSPFVVLGVHRGLEQQKILKHADDYKRVVTALRDGTLDVEKLSQYEFLNSNLDAVIKRV